MTIKELIEREIGDLSDLEEVEMEWPKDIHEEAKATAKLYFVDGNVELTFELKIKEVWPPPLGEVLFEGLERSLTCPRCGSPVWDQASPDQRLNKCWECGLRFDSQEDNKIG